MIRLDADRPATFCDGLTRRDFLHAGALAPLGLTLPRLPAGRRPPARQGRRRELHHALPRRRAEPARHLGPEAERPGRGPRAVPADQDERRRASQISEIFPKMAKHADKFSLVRSVYHTATAVHDTGHQMMQTGRLFTGGIEHPHVGCALGYLKGGRGELPAHVLLPRADRPHRRQPAARPDGRLPRQAARSVHPERRPERARTSRCPTCCRRTTSPASGPNAGRSSATRSTARSTAFENERRRQAARRQLPPRLPADVAAEGPRGVRPGEGAGRRSATATAARASASAACWPAG